MLPPRFAANGPWLRRLWLPAAVLALALLAPARPVAAHPLGNFTINRYSALTLDAHEIRLDYVVDMAEIPTYQRWSDIDRDGDGVVSPAEHAAFLGEQVTALAANLRLRVNGQPLTLRPQDHALVFPPGQADLPTMRLDVRFAATMPDASSAWEGDYADGNFADRLGWQEVVVRAGDGVRLTASTAPAEDLSQALEAYPDDLLQSPPTVRSARFTFVPAGAPAAGPAPGASMPASAPATPIGLLATLDAQYARLITLPELSPAIVAAALLAAFGLGALHALTPGHGKAIVGAYLVGSRGTARHAVFLGLTTTLTHTIGVFALGLLVLFASRYVLPERLYPWLGAVSGLMLVGIGLSLFRRYAGRLWADRAHRAHAAAHAHSHDHAHVPGHDHDHRHDPDHGHDHTHDLTDAVTWRNLLALGVSGGLLPCPSALIVLLSAVALGRVGFGLVLIVVFSVGLASVLTGIGLLVVFAGRLLARLPGRSRHAPLLRVVPALSALLITVVGAGFIWQALRQIGPF